MGESKNVLISTRDLGQLTGKNLYFYWREDLPRSGQEWCILEKLVHNNLLELQDTELLIDPRIRIIFLIRKAVPTLTSFMRALDVAESRALDYFRSRMDYLVECARRLVPYRSCVFLTYEELLHCSQLTFRILEKYLTLKQPLTAQYKITKNNRQIGPG